MNDNYMIMFYLIMAVVAIYFIAIAIKDCQIEAAERKEFDTHVDELQWVLDNNSSEVNAHDIQTSVKF